jgi:hypothetical protein
VKPVLLRITSLRYSMCNVLSRFLIAILTNDSSFKYANILLKLFQKIISHIEKEWYSSIDGLIQTIIQLSSEKELLLSKFKFASTEFDKIMEDTSLTIENLGKHKLLVQEAIGRRNAEESKRIQVETQRDTLEKEIKFWLEDWDTLHNAPMLIVN